MTTHTVLPESAFRSARLVTGVAWIAMLATSALPFILFNELSDAVPGWLVPAQLALLAALLAATFVAPALGPLRPMTLVLATIVAGTWTISVTELSARLQTLLPAGASPFAGRFLTEQGGRLLLALVMIAVLWLIYRDRASFFLSAGDPGATAAPIRWLGISEPVSWSRLGPIAGVLIALGVVAFIWLGARPSLSQLGATVSLMPLSVVGLVLLVALLNSFAETMTYRASFLAALETPVGPTSALLMAAVWFGIGHFYGVPSGVIGAMMATFLGWFLGRSVLETRGIVWAWSIHFLQDTVIFFFLALAMVRG